MPSIAELAVQLTANTGRFTSNIRQAGSVLSVFSSASKLAAAAYNPLATALIGGVGAGAALYWIKSQADEVERMGTMSDKLNTSTENLSAMKLGAAKANIEFDELTAGMGNFQKIIAKANTGDKESIRLLQQMGLSAKTLASMDMTEAVGLAADQIDKLGNANDRLLASTLLFGKQGGGMLAFLKDGSAGLEAMKAKAEALGYSFSRVDAELISRANNAFIDLAFSVNAIAIKLAIDFAPIAQACAEKLVTMGNDGESMGDKVVNAVEWSIRSFARMDQTWIEMKMGIAEIDLTLISVMKHTAILIDMLEGSIGLFGGVASGAAAVAGAKDDSQKFIESLDKDAEKIRQNIHDWGQKILDPNDLSPFQESYKKFRDNAKAEAEQAVKNNKNESASLDGLMDKYEKMGQFKQTTISEAGAYQAANARGGWFSDMRVHGLTSLAKQNQNKDPQVAVSNKYLEQIANNTQDMGGAYVQ